MSASSLPWPIAGGHGTESGEPVRRIGPYRVVATLGEGGTGAVYLGRDTRGQIAAVKALRDGTAATSRCCGASGGRRTRRRRCADRGWHPSWRTTSTAPVPRIAAEYLAGPTLHEAVTELGVFTEDAARALPAEVARAVSVIHDAGLVHRDLKPSNIVLTRKGATGRRADPSQRPRQGPRRHPARRPPQGLGVAQRHELPRQPGRTPAPRGRLRLPAAGRRLRRGRDRRRPAHPPDGLDPQDGGRRGRRRPTPHRRPHLVRPARHPAARPPPDLTATFHRAAATEGT
ncbi:hypothetical protein IQ210_42725 [Streptomyces sp. 3R004]|nr:hypothetical protein [Streptomyces justiciae]